MEQVLSKEVKMNKAVSETIDPRILCALGEREVNLKEELKEAERGLCEAEAILVFRKDAVADKKDLLEAIEQFFRDQDAPAEQRDIPTP